MFSEEIQRTIQRRYLESGSEKQFVFNKVPESVFLAWLFQQYEILQQLQISSNETYCSASSALSEILPQQNSGHGFKTLDSTEARSKNVQEYSSSRYLRGDKNGGESQRKEMKQKLCKMELLGSLAEHGDDNSLVPSAFYQISLSGNGDRFQKRRTICPTHEATSYADKAYLVNKERYLESTEARVCNINVGLHDASRVHRFLFFPEKSKTFLVPTSLHFSIIPPSPFFYLSNANPSPTLEILNNNTILCYPVPHTSKTISPNMARSHTFQPTCVVSDCNDQNEHTLDQSLRIKNCSESNPSLPFCVAQSDSSLQDSFHSEILSSMEQFTDDNDRLDDECFNTLNPLDPPAMRDLQNPVAKLLSAGDDKHFIPIEEDILEQ